MKKTYGFIMLVMWGAWFMPVTQAFAFCGFYVAKADTKLFNKASKVVLARHEDKTVITMANDYQGDLKEFAIVIPVPTFLEEDQIHVTDNKIIDHLDAYTAPRLVEYFDENPCLINRRYKTLADPLVKYKRPTLESADLSLGVTVEAEYTVGEYDIKILSAKESDGLGSWLTQNGYKIPQGATEMLGSYVKQGMRFFVAKVNVKKQLELGYAYLRPLQVAFESPKYMLPIRLGMVNADEDQELFVFALTKKGRVETTNYRTVKLPTDMDIPIFTKNEFGNFYKNMFNEQVRKEGMKTVFLEYAWNMSWCDPCVADPLSRDELRELGVFWLIDNKRQSSVIGTGNRGGPVRPTSEGAQDVYVTRLHVRYDAEHFPEDLRFKETGDTSNFQGRYVLRHPWKGDVSECKEAALYLESLSERFEKEAQALAHLTGWDINDIRGKMNQNDQSFKPRENMKWWQSIWSD